MFNGIMTQDEFWMEKAYRLAQRALKTDEVPVGAILVKNGRKISIGWNKKEEKQTCMAHAEMLAIERASRKLKQWRLLETTLYVTMEPCVMCAGALLQSRVQRVVFGAYDPKGGAFVSLFQLGQDERLNHRIDILGGVLEAKCSIILKEFFAQKRSRAKEHEKD